MTFRPVVSSNSYKQNLGQMNDMVRSLNKEQQVKAFNGANGDTALQIGKYDTGKYGLVGYDTSGYRRILIGQAPDDGRPGIWVSKSGIDVITELGG
jgi:hypothetical protein